MSNTIQSVIRPHVDATEVERRIDFADGALGAAGHEVTDPALRDISRRVAAEEITGDQASALIDDHFFGHR